ncbi:MAG: sigma 54-interacting transcriptional regulator [Treponema sp.]|jgi:transcriptional regulator with AAA-type ATPase domain/transcriptional regulatory protein LevR|nr:sigma 54-interacting transcriptional regulator [Treponema sp.]
MIRKQAVYEFLRKMKNQRGMNAVYTTEEIAGAVGASRANVSSDLNRLFEAELVDKLTGWPVRYRASAAVLTPMPEKDASLTVDAANEVFEGFIGYNGSMGMEIEKAKAAVLYPLSGLPLLIGGKTGVGKTTFAKLMFEYARKAGRIKDDARFVSFNCADYANNPQLIMAQLFGYAKGSYTGADASRDGLVQSADGGVLFLDEVHRLPETSQEMLFFLMDYGKYHRLGEADISRKASPIIIMATTEDRGSALLAAFNRRIPIVVTLPPLDQRSPIERLDLVRRLFTQEGVKLGKAITVDVLAIKALLSYDCPGNVGQLENDIKVACAQSYVSCLMENQQTLNVGLLDFPGHVKEGIRKLKDIYSDINLIARDFSISLELENSVVPADPRYQTSAGNPDIYRILAHRYEEFAGDDMGKNYLEFVMTSEIKNYFQRLFMNQDEELFEKQGINEVPSKIYDITRHVEEIITCELGLALDERSRSVIVQHINAAVSHAGTCRAGGESSPPGNGTIIYPAFSKVREDRPDVFDAASQIVVMMKQEYGLELPENETGIIANLILRIYDEKNQKERCGIVVVCHGLGSAKNMARLANSVVAREFVSWLDVAMEDITTEDLYRAAAKKIAELDDYEHLVVLTDSPALFGLCADLEARYNKKLYLVSDISTSMVIEAAILAVEHRATGQQIRSHLKTLEHGYNELYRLETKNLLSEPKKGLIVTACISGCGAAKKLKKIIEDCFKFPDYIEILTLDLPSVEELRQRISSLAKEQELICVIGMVEGLEIGFPFISAMEFVLGSGVQRLGEILQNRCLRQGPQQAQPGFLEEQYASGKYLENYLFYLSAEKTIPYLNECMEKIEKSRGKLDRGKRIMMLLHLASMLERLIFEERNQSAPRKASADLVDACKTLETMYRIRIGDGEYKMLEQILALKLGNFAPVEENQDLGKEFVPQKSVLA